MTESFEYVLATILFLIVPLVCGLAIAVAGVGRFRKGGRASALLFTAFGLLIAIGAISLWFG